MINASFCICYAKYYFQKITGSKNQMISFFCRLTNPTFITALPVDHKINLASPKRN